MIDKLFLFGVLPFGLVFSLATKTRLSSLPLGVGEFSLCIALLYLIGRLWMRQEASWSTVIKYVFILTFLSVLSTTFGALINKFFTIHTPLNFWHDAFAYTFVLVLFTVILVTPITKVDARRIIYATFVFSSAYLVALCLLQLFDPSMFGGVWHNRDVRLAGFSSNPNQFALLLLLMPFWGFLILWSARTTRERKVMKTFVILSIILTITAGWLTMSQALQIPWVLFFFIYLMFVLGSLWSKKFEQRGFAFLVLGSVTISLLLAEWIKVFLSKCRNCFSNVGFENVQILFENVHFRTEEIIAFDMTVRLNLLSNGVNAFMQSPIFGLGPGSFSGINAPFMGSESHNSFIDWLTSFGIVGTLLLVTLSLLIIYFLSKEKSWVLLSAFLVLGFFAMCHHIMRHPLVWVYACLLLKCCISEKKTFISFTRLAYFKRLRG